MLDGRSIIIASLDEMPFVQFLEYITTIVAHLLHFQKNPEARCISELAEHKSRLRRQPPWLGRVAVRVFASAERQWPLSYMTRISVRLFSGEVVDWKQIPHVDPLLV